MNNYIELILCYINNFLEWSNLRQDNIFGINPDEDTLEDY